VSGCFLNDSCLLCVMLFQEVMDSIGLFNAVESVFLKVSVSRWGGNEWSVFLVWADSLLTLKEKNFDSPPNIEPLLFTYSDYLERSAQGFTFLKRLSDLEVFVQKFPPKLKRRNDAVQMVRLSKEICEGIVKLSVYFLSESFHGVDSILRVQAPGGFYCLVREFHPSRLVVKHPWNAVQAKIQRNRSIEKLLSYDESDPLRAERFMLGGNLYGIKILDGHHRVYEIYRRFVNGLLNDVNLEGRSGGDILVRFIS
jgi:hypothetical protein